MKSKQIILTLICCISMQLLASAQFAYPVKIIDGRISPIATNMVVNDFTGDGSIDILGYDFFYIDFFLLENHENGQFELDLEVYQNTVDLYASVNYPTIFGEDFTGDNVADLYTFNGNFVCLKNDGTGNFTIRDSFFVDTYPSATSIVSDLDGDGWNDIVYIDDWTYLKVLKNNGNNFELPVPIETDSSLDDLYDFDIFDYNSDNRPDLIILFYNRIEIYLNNPDNTFSFFERIEHNEALVNISVSDFSQNNNIDIIGVGETKVTLFRKQNSSWTIESLIEREDDGYFEKIELADLDNNMNFEIIALEYIYEGYGYNKLSIYRNWDNQFADTIQINDTIFYSNQFELADVNNDSLLDLVLVNSNTGNIGWMNNLDLLGSALEIDSINYLFPLLKSKISNKILFDNVNSDEQKEILFTKINQELTNQLTLADGTPLNEEFTENVLMEIPVADFESYYYDKIVLGDVNGDNYKDLIQKIDSLHYAVILNNGTDGYSDNPIIVDIDSTIILDFDIFGLFDKDSDGDLDLYSSFKFSDGWRLVWLLNDGAGNFNDFLFIDSAPNLSEEGFKDILLDDVNGDEMIDLIAYTKFSVIWYQNQGNGNFGPKNILMELYLEGISPATGRIGINLEIVDLNGDGDNEVFIFYNDVDCIWLSCEDIPTTRIYDYNSTSGKFELIKTNYSWPIIGGSDVGFKLVYKDFNVDGNIDILTVNLNVGELIILYGDGLGNFSDQFSVISSSIFKTIPFLNITNIGLYLTDIEEDGDIDIIFLKSSTILGSAIYLVENKEIDLGVDGDEDGIALVYDCNDADSSILDTLLLPQILASLQNCEGDELLFEIANLQNVNYTWQTPNGSNSNSSFEIESALISDAGNYTVQANINQCESEVSTVAVDVIEKPEVSIELVENTLEVISEDENLGIQWFFNGQEIVGANNSNYTPTETGDYHVEVINESGCEASSEVFQHIVNGLLSNHLEEFNIYPNPVSNNGIINLDISNQQMQNQLSFSIQNISGQEVQNGTLNSSGKIKIENLGEGMYMLVIKNNEVIGKSIFMVLE